MSYVLFRSRSVPGIYCAVPSGEAAPWFIRSPDWAFAGTSTPTTPRPEGFREDVARFVCQSQGFHMYRGASPAVDLNALQSGEAIMLKQEAAEYNLLVTHHLSEPSHGKADIGQMMEAFGEWIEVAASVYVLWTNIPRREVHERIRHVVDQSDAVAVIDLAGCFSGPEGLLSLATH